MELAHLEDVYLVFFSSKASEFPQSFMIGLSSKGPEEIAVIISTISVHVCVHWNPE